MTTRTSRRAAACALLVTTILASPAFAQSLNGPPPIHSNVDENGVDLVTGAFVYSITEGAIGTGEGAVSLERISTSTDGFKDNWTGGLYPGPDGRYYVDFGDISDSFTLSGTTYTSVKGNGATLTGGGLGGYTYTAADGTVVNFISLSDNNFYPLQGYSCPNGTLRGACAIPAQVTRPNGMKFLINWTIVEKCSVQTPDCEGGVGTGFFRFQGVSSSAGYGFTVRYLTDNPGNFSAPQTNWYAKTGVTFSNAATGCDSSCPALTYNSGNGATFTDALSRQWVLTGGSIRRPGETSPSTVAHYTSNVLTSVTRDGVTTGYSRSVSGNSATTVITDPLGHGKTIVADLALGRITSVTDELGRTTSYQYDGNGRPTQITLPEGNIFQFGYDARGNVTSKTAVAKSGSGLANIVSTASFDTTCSSIVKCNKPNSTTDARLGRTVGHEQACRFRPCKSRRVWDLLLLKH